jgi:hypothetical protein
MRDIKLNPSAVERSTAATDLLLTLVAVSGIVLLNSTAACNGWKLHVWNSAFALIALAAALGAIAHGIVLPERFHRWLWQILNMALGLAISLFVVGVVFDLAGRSPAARMLPLMLAGAAVFFIVTICFKGAFRVFIIYEALALCFALGAYGWLAVNKDSGGYFLMAGGILTSIVAALVQTRRGLAWQMIWRFDHNGVFHLLQTIGLILLVAGLSLTGR